MEPTLTPATNNKNILLFFDFMGNLIQARTYGYGNFESIMSKSIILSSNGEYFMESLKYTTPTVTKF